MPTLLEKAQTLTSANVGAMLDRALRSNSLAVLDEYIGQLQDHLEDLEDATATIGQQAKNLRRKIDEFEAKARALDRDIDALLLQGGEELAIAVQRKLNNAQAMVGEYREQRERQQKEYQPFLQARLRLEAKLTATRQEREQLQALLESARTKEIAPPTLRSLDELAGVQDAEIARAAGSLRNRIDIPPAGPTARPRPSDEQVEHLLDSQGILTQLEARKRRLGLVRPTESRVARRPASAS